MRREGRTDPVVPHSSPMRHPTLSALPKGGNSACQQGDPIIVTIDIDVPADRVLGAELDLIEQYLGDLLQEMLLLDNEAKE